MEPHPQKGKIGFITFIGELDDVLNLPQVYAEVVFAVYDIRSPRITQLIKKFLTECVPPEEEWKVKNAKITLHFDDKGFEIHIWISKEDTENEWEDLCHTYIEVEK